MWTHWRRKGREKVIDSSEHKGPQETAEYQQWIQAHTGMHVSEVPMGSMCQAFTVVQWYTTRRKMGHNPSINITH